MDYWDYWWILALAIVLLLVGYYLLVKRAEGAPESAIRRRWFGMVTLQELELEKKMAGLRYEIEKLREGLYESSRREAAALLQANELRITVQNLMGELDSVREAQTQLSQAVHSRRRLLLVLGSERRFNVDLAAARAVRAKTGLDFIRVQDATADKIQRHLDRARATGNAIDYMHIASHGNDKGLDLGGQLLTWDWLSGVLDGVQVLVVAACESTILADWLGVVPYVVSVSESVENEDAGRFSQAFWMEIGRGVAPGEAYDRALARCPAQMREFVIAHW